jgi:hypothetical protein
MRITEIIHQKSIPIILLSICLLEVKAQNAPEDAIVYTIANDIQVNSKQLEFDLLLWDSIPGEVFQLATVQAGITLNPAIINGGTMTASIIPGTSMMNSSQQPTSITFTASQNVVKLAAKTPPGCGNGTIISTDPLSRTRLCRIRISNTADFTSNTYANLTFSFATVVYPTKVSFYQSNTCTNTPAPVGITNVYSMASNVCLNCAPTCPFPFNVTGGGYYCEGEPGILVGLSGSEPGVTYTLFKDGIAQIPSFIGTGGAISFGIQLAGTYTVVGVNTVCPDGTPMTGSAVITEIIVGTQVQPVFASIGPLCQNSVAPALPLTSQNGISGSWFPATINTAMLGQQTFTFTPTISQCILGATMVIIIDPLPGSAGAISGPTSIMAGSSGITFSIEPIAYATYYVWGYTGGGATITGNGTPTVIIDFDFGANSGQLTVHGNNICGEGTPSSQNITIQQCYNTIWTGLVNNDWNNPGNWNSCVPYDISFVTIPVECPNYPIIQAGKDPCKVIMKLYLEDGAEIIGQQNLCPLLPTTVYRSFPNSYFHFLSSPIVVTTFEQLFPPEYLNDIYSREYNESTGDWANNIATDYLIPGKGYSMKMITPHIASFIGGLNGIDIVCSLSNSNPSTEINRVGWNLLGNPFPSAIDWDLIPQGLFDSQVAVWDQAYGGYRYWNHTIGNLVSGVIPPENGFFVKTTNPGGASLVIPLSAQVFSNHAFYKESVSNVLDIKADANGYSDEAFVHFNNDATAGFDSKYDAFKFWGMVNAPQIYYKISSYNLSINELPFEGNETLDLGFKCGIDGNYTLTGLGMESFDAATPIKLEDLKTHSTQDLRLNPVYSFNYATDDIEARFRLHFKSAYDVPESSIPAIDVYSVNNTVIIRSPSNLDAEITISDMMGRTLLHEKMSNQYEKQIPFKVAVGNYLVRLKGTKYSVCKKVFVQ